MFIQTETTPNPNSLKFMPGITITGGEPINYTDKEQCSGSGLAKLLFNIDNVSGVFFGADFITVTKEEGANWDLMKPEILVTIMDYLVSGRPALDDTKAHSEKNNEDDSDVVKQIKELIETRVRPAVAQDGGDIIYIGFEDGVVKLELHGSCSGCPSSTVTLKSGIESMLKHYVPEVISVESVN